MDAAFASVGLDVNDHVMIDQSLLRPLDISSVASIHKRPGKNWVGGPT